MCILLFNMAIENIIYLVIALFVLILVVKPFLGKKGEKICAICLSFALTWIVLLFLYYFGKFDNLILIGLLIGLTILGIYYTLERNVSREKTIFRLPLLLTLILIGYFVLTLENLIREAIIVAVLWSLFGVLYFYRHSYKLKKFVDKIVECCKKW